MSESIIGMEELRERLKGLQDLTMVRGALIDAAKVIEGELSVYPEAKRLKRRDVYGTPFKTEKQRRFFFWALGQGIIEVPYHRGESPGSERHKASWNTQMGDGGLTARIGSDTTYGPYLQDPEKQSQFARAIGWRTTDIIFAEQIDGAIQLISEALEDTVNQ